MIYQVLLVDDEPHVVSYLSSLIEKLEGVETEIHAAYRAVSALETIRNSRIDLLITDIQMPGMTGLELVKEVRENWPECVSIILTAYPDFNYAYEAIAQRVVSYVLKSENEDSICLHLKNAFDEVQNRLRHQELAVLENSNEKSDSAEEQQTLRKLLRSPQLLPGQMQHMLHSLGIPQNAITIALMIFCRNSQPLEKNIALRILGYYFKRQLIQMVRLPIASNACFVLLALKQPGESPAILTSMLETVQTSVCSTSGQCISLIVGTAFNEDRSVPAVYERLYACMQRALADFSPCVLNLDVEQQEGAHITASYLKSYIKKHVNEDLSLSQLSCITGYNASYLSRIFSQSTHETLAHYISRKRLAAIATLMNDNSLSLEEIAEKMNFTTRSYFNRFIKKETGLSPKKYRAQLCMHSSEHESSNAET